MRRQILHRALSYLIVPVCLLYAGWSAHVWYHSHYGHDASRQVKQKGFRFISPLLDVELPEGMGVRNEPLPFKYKVNEFVQQQIATHRVSELSVYYRDLADGPWFGINEGTKFNPASMMKVPVMIAWLKRAERDPTVLNRKFSFDNKQENLTALQNIKPRHTITLGKKYTVDELLHFMMNYSDNNATSLLYNSLTPEELNDVLDSMDINNDPTDGNNAITVHGYSGFFRILYNAAYLNREMSEKALQLLSLQDFPQGIAAGVPQGVPVAAKFGEDAQGEHGEDKQLHEFGIVYHPQGPYILGIMTRGHDTAIQAGVIRDVSALVYNEVAVQRVPKTPR
ncbi:MAG TPA: serine hydrolase [Geobacteraceae bacterium]